MLFKYIYFSYLLVNFMFWCSERCTVSIKRVAVKNVKCLVWVFLFCFVFVKSKTQFVTPLYFILLILFLYNVHT